jgi:hypothetical protein
MSTTNRSSQAETISEYDSFSTDLHSTSSATPVLPAAQYADYGFIAVLALAQRLRIDFLPITLQAPLDILGRGAQGVIYQTLINSQTSFAFKRFHKNRQNDENKGISFQDIISEMIVLSHPSIREHPYIVRLEGICWDIPQDDQVWPVLVFQKTHLGDLCHFAISGKGRNLRVEDRLKLCTDIGIAIRDMHSYSKRSHTKVILGGLSSNRYHSRRYQASERTYIRR